MKHLSTVVFLFSLCFSARAQYTITSVSAPKAGDKFITLTDTVPTFTRGEAGANKNWDFSSFVRRKSSSVRYQLASDHELYSDFPNADLVVPSSLGESFISVTESAMEIIGAADDYDQSGDGKQPLHYDNPETVNKYPSTYGSSYTDSSSYTILIATDIPIGLGYRIDSVRIIGKTNRSVVYDAYGTITTPQGFFPNSIREKAFLITNDYNEYCVSAFGAPCEWVSGTELGEDPVIDSLNIYSWYNSKLAVPVASMTYDYNTDIVRNAKIYFAETGDGIGEVADYTETLVFPNPASDFIAITGSNKINTLDITDLTGRTVLFKSRPDSDRIQVSHLPKGQYILRITSAEGIRTTKISIVH